MFANSMKILPFVPMLVLLAACSKFQASGSEYVGSWKSSKDASRTLIVEQNGDTFMLSETAPERGKMKTTTMPAVLKDGVLKIENGFGVITIAHQVKNDTLVVPAPGGTAEYVRVK